MFLHLNLKIAFYLLIRHKELLEAFLCLTTMLDTLIYTEISKVAMKIMDRHGKNLMALLCVQQSEKMPHWAAVVIRVVIEYDWVLWGQWSVSLTLDPQGCCQNFQLAHWTNEWLLNKGSIACDSKCSKNQSGGDGRGLQPLTEALSPWLHKCIN